MTSARTLNVYWASRIIAGISGTAAPVVLTVATLDTTVGSSVLPGMLSAQAIGQLVALATAGAVIDRVNRKAFIAVVQTMSGMGWLTFSTLLYLDVAERIPWILLGAILGLLAGMNGPATQSLLAFLVEREKMKATVANIRISLNIVALLSPVIAGAAISILPPGVVPFTMGLLMLGSALTLSTLPAMRSSGTEEGAIGSLKGAFQGWFVVIIVTTSIMNLFWAGFFQLRGPITIAGDGGAGPAQWGVVSACFAAGLIAGGFYYRKKTFKDPLGTPILLLAPKAIPILIIAVYPHYVVLSIATFCAGFLLEAFAVNFYTQVQLRIPQHALGKALALDGFIGIGLLPIGFYMADFAASAGATETGGVLAAMGTVLFAVVGWTLLRTQQRTRGAKRNGPAAAQTNSDADKEEK